MRTNCNYVLKKNYFFMNIIMNIEYNDNYSTLSEQVTKKIQEKTTFL